MKKFRWIALLLTVAVLFGSLSSCAPIYHLAQYFSEESTTADFLEKAPSRPDSPLLPSEPNEPSEDDLAYTLTQADVDAMYAQISACELLLLGEALEEDVLQTLLEELEAAYYHIVTQAQLAYIYYCVDQVSEETSEAYLFASAASADVYNAYIAMCKNIDASESPNRAFFFRDWTEDEIAEMRGFSDEITAYTKANDEILVSYRALSNENFFNNAAEHYLRFLNNNNAIAQLNGYADYWAYASAEIYDRSYTETEMQAIRTYVKSHLVGLLEEISLAFDTQYASLTKKQQRWVELFMGASYDELGEDYVGAFINSFDGDTKQVLLEMLNEENSIFTESGKSYEGAFTSYLYEYERPICYFGPQYQDAFTVVHELGHYHSLLERGDMDIPIDLAEVHSQSNEFLFLAFLETTEDEAAMKTIRLYQLYNTISVIITAVLIDEFEQRCYEANITSADQFDLIMAEVIDAYGGATWLNSMYQYWRLVVLESPVYYLSYGVSALAALQVYATASDSYEAGQEAYLRLVESAAEGDDYIKALAAAGLSAPDEEETYLEIARLVNQD